jgi:hypothetical protein|tara:strand:+ start:459 stop:1004 length:546 start_codon:yes stop_codon:yes gene_type:complete
MKKFLLTLAIAFGLTQITQAQSSCDSTMSYTIGSQFQLEIAFGVGGNTPSTWSAPLYVATYGDGNMLAEDSCFGQACTHTIYNYNTLTGMPYDTLTTCVTYTVSDSIGNIDTLVCCFDQYWDGQAWARSMGGNPLSIDELILNNNTNNGKIYDLLGRELKLKFGDLPKGMYIINNRIQYKL